MAQLDLSTVWNPDPERRSAAAAWRGMAGLSLKQLRRRFLESLLIVLGIALGVGVLTGMSAFLRFLDGLSKQAMLSQTELRAVTVRPRGFDTSELWGAGAPAAVRLTDEFAEPIQLTAEDLLAVRRELPGAQYVLTSTGIMSSSPIVAVDGRPLAVQGEPAAAASELHLALRWVTPDEMAFRGREMIAGSPFTWDDYAEGLPVVILEEEGVEQLFPGLDPGQVIGRTIVTTAQQGGWRIVGVVAAQEPDPFAPSFPAWDASNQVTGYAPHTASPGGPFVLNQISIAPAEGVSTEQFASDVELFFAQRYGPDRVTVTDPVQLLREANESRRSVSLALLGLAAAALFVAAINILNLFTARVIRRRRLMSMCVALGADRRLLFQLTLSEALLLGAAGSLLGMLPAYGVITALKMLFLGEAAAMSPGLAELVAKAGLGWLDVLTGLAAGAGTSLLFGLYPAYLSASIDAAEGLKRE